VIGTKKLSAIRKQIEEAWTSRSENPIQRLDRQITSAKRKGQRTEVMEGLKRFLESGRKPGRRGRRPGSSQSLKRAK
jgi:hypothetical protein